MRRDKAKELIHFLDDKKKYSNVLIINGARQVGKTYLVEDVLQNYPSSKVISINLEKMPDIKMEIDKAHDFYQFTKIIETKFGFKNNDNFILFIDEAQESEGLGRFVRDMKESWTNTKSILTGSSMHRLFEESQRIPVGRVEYLTIYPYSFREFLRAINKENLIDLAKNELQKNIPITDILHHELIIFFNDYLKIGGLPEVVWAYGNNEEWEKILNFIVATQRDDFLRKDKVKSHLFLDGLRGVSNHVGGISKFTHVSDNQYDSRKIIGLLIDWHLVNEVPIASGQTTQAISQKRYLYDLGMLRLNRATPVPEISVLSTLDEALRAPLGGIIENSVLLSALNLKQLPSITCWRKNKKDSLEVDFIIKTSSKILPIEVKAALKVTNRHVKNIRQYSKINKVDFGILTSFDNYKEFMFEDIKLKVINIPIYLLEEFMQIYFDNSQ